MTSQFAYTWAHSLDLMTAYRGAMPQDNFNPKADYGNSDFDGRHAFTAVVTYDLPTPSKGPKLLLGGWQLSGLAAFRTGQPFNITTSNDNTGTDEGNQRPNLIGDPYAGVSHSFNSSGVTWLNPAAFAQPTAGTFGNLSRNKFYGPGYGAVDLAVFKNTKITERIGTQLRVEMFNLFNRKNLAPPSGTFGSGSFLTTADTIGDYNGAPGIGPGEPFNVQLALKLIF